MSSSANPTTELVFKLDDADNILKRVVSLKQSAGKIQSITILDEFLVFQESHVDNAFASNNMPLSINGEIVDFPSLAPLSIKETPQVKYLRASETVTKILKAISKNGGSLT